ncbi:YcxB family protein [Kitasatospora sp. HPMI-4]|uniref:YcxB family protein n=1 Tax=Kitasatospora sp. HPMI-4 TaxID=3448443 RepID=UPI003F1D0261
MHLTATYEVTRQELLRANKQAFSSRREALWACCTGLLITGLLEISTKKAITLGAISLAFGLMSLLQLTVGTRISAKRMMAVFNNPAEVTITEEEVSVRRPGSHTTLAWSSLERVMDTEEFVFIYQAKRARGFILKRGFTPEQQEELSAFLATLPIAGPKEDRPVAAAGQ